MRFEGKFSNILMDLLPGIAFYLFFQRKSLVFKIYLLNHYIIEEQCCLCEVAEVRQKARTAFRKHGSHIWLYIYFLSPFVSFIGGCTIQVLYSRTMPRAVLAF